ncbi:hypothetical protein [Pseudokordiimonas caeni]|uniref:hypothetical protein n=1 Tax=Pseudokordiimonas caeni TaxID=2997908 RepID=UPI002810EBD5|nr:hypothetical protein [Pseudokordiimonas caeni]
MVGKTGKTLVLLLLANLQPFFARASEADIIPRAPSLSLEEASDVFERYTGLVLSSGAALLPGTFVVRNEDGSAFYQIQLRSRPNFAQVLPVADVGEGAGICESLTFWLTATVEKSATGGAPSPHYSSLSTEWEYALPVNRGGCDGVQDWTLVTSNLSRMPGVIYHSLAPVRQWLEDVARDEWSCAALAERQACDDFVAFVKENGIPPIFWSGLEAAPDRLSAVHTVSILGKNGRNHNYRIVFHLDENAASEVHAIEFTEKVHH